MCFNPYLPLYAGRSVLGDLIQALNDYLPVLLGLVKDGKSVRIIITCMYVLLNISTCKS